MNFSPEELHRFASVIRLMSFTYPEGSDEWAVYTDAADALDDFADLREEEANG